MCFSRSRKLKLPNQADQKVVKYSKPTILNSSIGNERGKGVGEVRLRHCPRAIAEKHVIEVLNLDRSRHGVLVWKMIVQ